MNMAGNPSRWSMHPASQFSPSPSLFPSQFVFGTSSSSPSPSPSLPFNPLPENLELPHQSWSQLLVGGLPGEDGEEEEDRYGLSNFQQIKKLGNWEEQMLNLNPPFSRVLHPHPHHVVGDIKQNINLEGHEDDHEEFQTPKWSSHNHHQHHQVNIPHVSSPRSCVTTSPTTNMLDFSYTNPDASNHQPDQSSECKSTSATGGACKKARVQPSSSQPPLKVRKEKLGDRITALHQLVSPFGKTDTASVLLEAIGYIRFLQGQIEALSSPYLTTSSSNIRNHPVSVQNERNSVFPEDPGQLLNDICLKRKGGPNLQDSQDNNSKPKDLRSRGLCLVRLSCTQHVGNDNGADFWAPTIGGNGF
ncbi:basic helix-loop-helix (bHLH) DNA-binding superfamily protein [Euphorbia peplus]|nr:basic helix-loop-helix (bHLH) DNA-binding superfamily protein [Euphorbia peplus]